MILHLKNNLDEKSIAEINSSMEGILINKADKNIYVTGSSRTNIPSPLRGYFEDYWVFENDIQLASRKYLDKKREVIIGETVIGGSSKNTIVITGPCSVESEDQIRKSAKLIHELKLSTIRGGCYKPRTSPYSFQGLGIEGLQLLSKMKTEYGVNIITEVRDATHVNEVIEYSDVIQVGAKAMYDQGILRACAKSSKPILIKRGFGSTLQEFVQAAEFVLSGGNENVILCERGIRTFESKTRFTLDLCGVSWLQENVNLPIILDPSHAMGYAYGIPALSRACVAMGIDGLMIETHPEPTKAKSDVAQQLNHEEFKNVLTQIKPVAESIGYEIV